MNAHDGFQLWSDRFDRDLDDIFALQDEIARAIVERLELTLGLRAAEPLVPPPTDNFEAYQLYLRGREAVQQRSSVSMRRGVEFFRQALARDPDYAKAYAGLAEAYNGLGIYQYMPSVRGAAERSRRRSPPRRVPTRRWRRCICSAASASSTSDPSGLLPATTCVLALRHAPQDPLWRTSTSATGAGCAGISPRATASAVAGAGA